MQETPTVVELGSVSGSVVSFAFFLVVCAAAGTFVYLLLTRPRFRRKEIQGLGRVSWRVAAAVSAGVFLTTFLLVYFTSINGFQSVTADATGLRCDYILPSRTVTIPLDEVEIIDRVPASRWSWRLRVVARNGDRYLSLTDSAQNVDLAIRRVQQLVEDVSDL